jgi:formylglycine-generating enzyme required for sulfatase activity
MKKSLMYNKEYVGYDIVAINKYLWSYEYYSSQSSDQNGRYGIVELEDDSTQLIPFDYKGIKFNMIACLDVWDPEYVVEPFMLGETEVTQELFEAVMGFNYSEFKKPTNKNPVSSVTWFDCLDFCNKLSDYFGFERRYILKRKKLKNNAYPLSISTAEHKIIEYNNGFRLPDELEWQLAAKAGTDNEYAGVNNVAYLKKVAWFKKKESITNKYRPVAQKLPNEWGFYDMSGNIDEWCENAYNPGEDSDSSANRVCLGGGFDDVASDLLLTTRVEMAPESIARVGIRVARTI